LAYQYRKAVALDAQQIQQLLISTMKHRPAHLLLNTVAQLLQLLPGHLALPDVSACHPGPKSNPDNFFRVGGAPHRGGAGEGHHSRLLT
jgi:hypothetical protein